MKDLDSQQLSVNDFPRWYRFKMVAAYRVISDVPDPYAATHVEIDAGFRRCLDNRNLRVTHEQFLESLIGEPGQG
jgi:hypothetical protein